jgi:hypothetical protein
VGPSQSSTVRLIAHIDKEIRIARYMVKLEDDPSLNVDNGPSEMGGEAIPAEQVIPILKQQAIEISALRADVNQISSSQLTEAYIAEQVKTMNEVAKPINEMQNEFQRLKEQVRAALIGMQPAEKKDKKKKKRKD